jgi:hypothetical protein
MKPYCRYCHGDHALKDCVLRAKWKIYRPRFCKPVAELESSI